MDRVFGYEPNDAGSIPVRGSILKGDRIMGKFEKDLKKIDKLILFFRKISKKYPKAGYETWVDKLQIERANHVNSIGKNKRKNFQNVYK